MTIITTRGLNVQMGTSTLGQMPQQNSIATETARGGIYVCPEGPRSPFTWKYHFLYSSTQRKVHLHRRFIVDCATGGIGREIPGRIHATGHLLHFLARGPGKVEAPAAEMGACHTTAGDVAAPAFLLSQNAGRVTGQILGIGGAMSTVRSRA